MRVDLIDLGLFVHVSEAGSITGGAQRAHLTLASASERIRGLESRLGQPLLQRRARGVVLTDAGAVLLQHARRVLAEMTRLQAALTPFASGQSTRIRVFVNTSGLSDWLPHRLPAFLRAHPQVQVETEEHVSGFIADAVRQGRCELGIVSDAADLHGLQCRRLRADPLVLAVPVGHPLAGREALAIAGVPAQPFVGLMDDAAQQQLIERHLAASGSVLNWRLRVRSLEDVCRMVGQGVGLAIVPAWLVRRTGRRNGISAVPLAEAWAHRSLMLCMRDMGQLSAAARALVDALQPARQAG